MTCSDFVVGDTDGVLFLPEARLDDITVAAVTIRDTERRQAHAMATGRSLRHQLRFGEYMSHRDRDANYSFRQHLRDIQAAIEE